MRQVVPASMSELKFISDYWWFQYPTCYGICGIELHFEFMIDMYGLQMIHRANYIFVRSIPPPFFFLLFNPIFVIGFEDDQDPPFFFHTSKHPML